MTHKGCRHNQVAATHRETKSTLLHQPNKNNGHIQISTGYRDDTGRDLVQMKGIKASIYAFEKSYQGYKDPIETILHGKIKLH